MRLRFLGIASLLFLTTSMRADVLFDSFGSGGLVESGIGIGIGPLSELAYPFVPSETARFDTAVLSIGTNAFFPERSVTIELLTDSSGSPGTVVESFQLVNSLPVLHGLSEPATVVDSLAHPVLETNTTYWLAIIDAGSTGSMEWDSAFVTPPFQKAFRELGANQSWSVTPTDPFFSAGAFQVTGTPNSAVPEPSSVLLFGCVLVATLIVFRRRYMFDHK